MSLFNNVLAGASGQQGYKISRSVRLRSSASAYFNRTPASATNRRTWTWSAWVKRGALSAYLPLLNAEAGGNTNVSIMFLPDNTLRLFQQVAGVDTFYLITTSVYRDPSAWYHIVVAVDTTQATNTNRLKMYVNGVQTTNTSTLYPSQNFDGTVNNNVSHYIGALPGAPYYFDGYMTEINFVDGQALTPSSFGETNAVTGVWQPKKYTGTYGTNGFYLNFSDNSNNTAATIGKDYSGNGNNWTPNNVSVTAGVTYDSMLDVPTNYADGGNGRGNYAVMNSLRPTTSGDAYADGNLKLTPSTAGAGTYPATMGISSGSWYWEVTMTNQPAPNSGGVGIVKDGVSLTTSFGVGSVMYHNPDGNKYIDGTATAYGASFTTNDVIGVAYNAGSGLIEFFKNGTSQGSFTPSGYAGVLVFPAMADGTGTSITHTYNFGQRPFAYTPPTGFVALNTQNLPTPTISNGANYMAATTFTATSGANTIVNTVNGVGFQPDFVWTKSRSNAQNNYLVDSVRGGTSLLVSNSTGAESIYSTPAWISSFNSSGYSSDTASMLTNAYTYVGWQWKAGGTAVTNTSGSITSTVSANPTAGFSVVTYTGIGSAATVGHGLGVAPAFIITKSRNIAVNWTTYHVSTGNSAYMHLNLTNASASVSNYWGTSVNSSTFGFLSNAYDNANGNIVAYCFAPVAGYSAFGSYTGNSSTDGPFVYLGFRPRFVMVKRTDSAGNFWTIKDTSRNTYNVVNLQLYPNSSAAEATATFDLIDIVSNGFKLRGTSSDVNASGGTYIYAAFAENPFKNSLAR
jgi:hypothetical protein